MGNKYLLHNFCLRECSWQCVSITRKRFSKLGFVELKKKKSEANFLILSVLSTQPKIVYASGVEFKSVFLSPGKFGRLS